MENVKATEVPRTGIRRKATTSRGWKTFKKNQAYLALTLPMLLFVFVFSYLPMGGAVVAFKNYQFNKGIWGSPWAGVGNFNFLLKAPDLVTIVRNTVGYNALFILLNLICGVAAALILYGITERKLLKAYQTVMIFPHFLSWVVVAYMTYAFLNPRSGMLNQLLIQLGWAKVDWYINAKAWIAILPIAHVWKEIGMGTLLYYAALMGIDPTFFEAAKIEGANKWQIATRIMVPCLYPLMTIITIMAIGHIFSSDFGLFYQLTMGSQMLNPTTDVIDTYIFRGLTQLGNIGMTSAAGLIKSVLGFILIILANAITRKINSDNSLF